MTVATQGDLSTLTSKELHQRIVNKDISVMELVEIFLSRIEKSANKIRHETLLHRVTARLFNHAASQSSW